MFESQESQNLLEPEPEKSKADDKVENSDFSENKPEEVASEPSEPMESDVNNADKEVEGVEESEEITNEPTEEEETDTNEEVEEEEDVPMDSEDVDDPAVLSEVQNTLVSFYFTFLAYI